MSALKEKIHHLAAGAASTVGTVTIGASTVAVGAGAIAFYAASTAGTIAVAIGVGATAIGVGVGTVAVALVADVVADKTLKYKDTIPADSQKTWRRCGAGLLATFSLACGIGTGDLVHDYAPKNDNAPLANQTTPATNQFNVQARENDECVIVVKNKQASTLSGSCITTLTPQ